MSIEPQALLSHYRLVEQIGQGGMGVVWRAVDIRLDREVALKLLPAELAQDPARLERLTAEAKAVAGLNHPNIVTVHSIEESDGQRFLVMELVQGAGLDRMLPGDGLQLPRFFQLAAELVDAIRAAHEQGLVHRDLKPGNIMVGHNGRLKVLDFGIAKPETRSVLASAAEAPTATLPTENRLQGTMAYMAPEQFRGSDADHRSDLFSLGVILYEMATGRRPFRGRTAAELIAAILRDEPIPLTELRPDLPRQLQRILQHALEKDPRRRFQTALDLHNELVQLRNECGHGGTGEGGRPAVSDVRSVAVLPLANLSGRDDQVWFADGMTDALISSLARIRALKVISRTSVMRYREARKPVPEIARELDVDAVVEGSVLRSGNRVRITAQLIDAARDRLLWAESYENDLDDVLELQGRVARAIAERIEVELTPQERAHLTRREAIDPRVHEAYLRGRHFWYRRTPESVRKGLACFEEAVLLAPGYAPAHAGVADSFIVDGGRYLGVAPKIAYGRAREAATRAVELDESLAEAHTSLAAVMTDYDWDWEGADREYRRAIQLNPNYATARNWYAEQLSRMGRHDEAVAEAWRGREIDPLSLVSNMVVAWILFFARRYDEAIEQGCRTLELEPDYATAHRVLGWAYEATGRCGEAITAHLRASALSGEELNFRGQLARAYALAGREREARQVLAELMDPPAGLYVSPLDVAIAHTALGEHDAAFRWLERALEDRADQLPYLMVNPRLDALRPDPRFRSLLERMHLPVSDA